MDFLLKKINLHSTNLANADTAVTLDGYPFKKLGFSNCIAWNCEVVVVGGYRLTYYPSHPAANECGYVQMPDINPLEELDAIIDAQAEYDKLIISEQHQQSECYVSKL